MQDLKLGQTLRDLTTGFVGVAVNRTEYMNGTVQYNLQPKAEEGKSYPDAVSIDEHFLEVVDEGISGRATESTFNSPIVLGNRVKCLVSGRTGIATLKTNYLNGCASFLVCCKAEENSQAIAVTEDWIDQCRLVVVGEGVADKVKKPQAASNGKKPGGAVMRGIPRG